MSASSVIERVKTNLVALKMPRALENLDVTMRGVERGEIGALEAIDALPEQISEIVSDDKKLLAIPGIGKGMVANLKEIFAEGSLRVHAELLSRTRASYDAEYAPFPSSPNRQNSCHLGSPTRQATPAHNSITM